MSARYGYYIRIKHFFIIILNYSFSVSIPGKVYFDVLTWSTK